MASKKEEVLFSVKAELQGFKKSMEDLKQLAKDSSKNIEKAMSLDLKDEGSKAGKSFAKGMNKELKGFTDTLKKELKLMSDKTYTIKIKLDSSSVDKVIRELSNIEIKVSASASNRANSSMSNNANAPNSANAMASMANTAALTNLVAQVNRAARLIITAVSKIENAKVGVDTKDAKVGVNTDGVKIDVDTQGVKVGVDADNVKVGVDTQDVKIGIDTSNIPEVELKVPEIQSIDAKIDTKDAKVGVDTEGVSVKIDENSIKQIKSMQLDVSPIAKTLQASGIKIDVDELNEAIKALNEAASIIKDASEYTRDAANDIDSASVTLDLASQDMVNAANRIVLTIEAVKKLIDSLNNASIKVEVPESIDVNAPESINVNAPEQIEVNAPESIDVNLTPATDALDQINSITDRISNTLNGVVSNLNDVSRNLSNTTISVDTQGLSSEVNNIDRLIDDMVNVADDLEDMFRDFRDTIGGTVESLGSTINNAISGSINTIRAEISNAFDQPTRTLKQGIVASFVVGGQKAAEEIKKGFNDSLSNINKSTSPRTKNQSDAFEAGLNAAKANMAGLEDAIDNLIESTEKIKKHTWSKLELPRPEKPHVTMNPKDVTHVPTTYDGTIDKVQEARDKIQEAKEKIKSSLNTGDKKITELEVKIERVKKRIKELNTELQTVDSDQMFAEISSKLARHQKTLAELQSQLRKQKELNGFDELSITIDDASDSVGKLRMNLQLLADDFDNYDFVKNTPEFKDLVKRSIERDGEPMFGEYSDLSLSKVFKEDVESLYKEINDAIEQGSDVFDKCILMFQNKIGTMQNILHLLPTKGWSDKVNSNNQWSKDTLKEMERTVSAREKELLDPVKEQVKKCEYAVNYIIENPRIYNDVTKSFEVLYELANEAIDSLPDESFKELKKLYRSYVQKGREAFEKEDSTSLSIRKDNKYYENEYDRQKGINDFETYGFHSSPHDGFSRDDYLQLKKLQKQYDKELWRRWIDEDEDLDEVKASLGQLKAEIENLESKSNGVGRIEGEIKGLSESLVDFAADPSSIKSKDEISFNNKIAELRKTIEEQDSFTFSKSSKKSLNEWLDNIVKTSKKYVFKPKADERFENEVKKLSEKYKSLEDNYEDDYVKQGLRDAFEQEKAMLDSQRKKGNIVDTIKEFKDLLQDSILEAIEYPPEIESKRGYYRQTINELTERLKSAFDKNPDENVVLELESTLGQFDDFIKDAPVDDAKKNIAKNIVNSIREQIKDAYKDISVDAVRSVIGRVNGQNEGILKLDDIKEDSIKDNDSSFDIEQLKEACKVLKEVQDTINDIANSMKAMLNDVLALAKQASASIKGGLGGDELAMTLDDANESISQLRMNLQLLADDSNKPKSPRLRQLEEDEKLMEKVKREHEEQWKKEEDAIYDSIHEFVDAIEQGKELILEIAKKYKAKTITLTEKDALGKSAQSAYESINEKFNAYKELNIPGYMRTIIGENFDEIATKEVDMVLESLTDKIKALENYVPEINLPILRSDAFNMQLESIINEITRLYNYIDYLKNREDIIEVDFDIVDSEDVLERLLAIRNAYMSVKESTNEIVELDIIHADGEIVSWLKAVEDAYDSIKKKLEHVIEVDFRVLDDQTLIGALERIESTYESTQKRLEEGIDIEYISVGPEDVVHAMEAVEDAYDSIKEKIEHAIEVEFKVLDDEVFETVKRAKNAMRTDSGMFSTSPNGPVGGGPGGGGRRADSGIFEFRGHIARDLDEAGQAADECRSRFSRLWEMLNQSDAHVFTHKMGQLKESLKKVSDAIKDIGTPFKKAFNGISSVLNKILSPIKKVISGFRNLGNEAKDASGKVNGLTGSFKGLLSKLAMMFGIREIFNIFKEGTKDAMSYEASIINLQLTYGKASQGLIDFANNHAIAFGLSKRQVAEYGNVYSAIMRDVNIAMAKTGETADDIAKKTMDMSQGILESAGIISSALGYDMEYVLEGLRSGLLGSSQAVDQFGLNLKRANLENSKAFKEVANGAESWEKLTVEQQQYVIAQEIINQTASKFGSILDENGKIMRTTASLHTQFLAQWQNTKLAVGNLGKVIWTAILPPLIKILAILEQIFNYAASAMTMILEMFNIKVDLNANLGGNSGLDSLGDTAQDTSDALNGVGDSAQDTAQDTEDAAKKIKRALAGFDQINVLTLGDDAEDNEIETPGLEEWNPTPIDPGELGVQLPDLSDDFKKKLDKLKQLFDEFITPFRAAWDILGNRWKKAWEDLKASFKNFCKSLADFLESVWWNGGQEFVRHMAEIALAVGIAAMEIGGTILDALAKLWKHLDPETNMNTQGFLDALNETAVKLRDLILDLNTHFESLMKNGGQDVLNALGDMFMNLGESAARGVGVVIDAIDGLLDHLDPANNDITRGMLEMWENAFLAIGDAALAFADLMESTLANGGQGVVNALGDLGVQILSTLGSITTDVAEACANLFAHLDPANNDITAGALEGFKYFVDSIRNFIEMLGESFSTFMDNGGQEFLNNMADIALILFDMAVTIGGDLLNSITAFFDSFAGHVLITTVARVLELLSTILKALLELLEPLTPVISAVIAAIGGFMVASKVVSAITTIVSVFQSFGSVLGLAKAGVSALWAIIAANPIAATVAAIVAIGVALVALYNKCEWFRDIVNSIFDGLREPIEKLKETFSELFEDVVDVFQNIIDFIVGIFTGDGERVGKAVREFVINIGEILLDLFKLQGNLAEIGFNLILGLVQGIWECIKQLPQLLLGIGEFIVDFFKGLFGIHSPSTVFAELGGYLIEGLAQGITDSLNLLDNVFSGVSDAISGAWDKVKTAWSEASDFFGGVWQSVKDTFDKIKDMSIPKPKIEWDVIKETASKVVGNVKETVEKFKADLPKPSVVWDSIKTTAERTISNVKDSVERFKASLPKPTLNWNDLKTTLTDALNKLKDTISRFKWELPKPKLPSFSVSGGKAPWGFMGQGSLPSISVKWNAQGGIMNSPTIFGMTGNTLLGGGEAGAEAILPLDELWNRLDNSFQQQNQALSRAIASSNNSGSNRPVNVVLKVNDIEMGKVVVNSLKSLSNHSGGSLDLPFNK